MAKSKLITASKKIETNAVDGFNRSSDKFVDRYLTKENESVADAKKRGHILFCL